VNNVSVDFESSHVLLHCECTATAATISGPSSASASVAAAIRAVRDEGLTRTPEASSDGGESGECDGQDLGLEGTGGGCGSLAC
jgi:hypothetical protein